MNGRTVANLRAAVLAGSTSAVDVTDAALELAHRHAELGIFVELFDESARAAAATADREMRAGRNRGPLHGIPIAVKDMIDIAGTWTRCGTPGLGHHLAANDAAAVRRLRAGGAIILGKTATHEMGWGMVTPGCRNPRAPDLITGGSSGGSAAAVAAGIVPLALGTDTGGSVRNPAALCGVVGLKAAVGTVNTDGVTPLAPTQDCVGLLAASIDDCVAGYDVLIGRRADASGRRFRVGVVTGRWTTRVTEPVAAAMEAGRAELTSRGVEFMSVSVPDAELAPATSYVIILAESAARWFPRVRRDPSMVSQQVREILEKGDRVAAVDYLRALQARRTLRLAVRNVLETVDALMVPTCPVTAAPHGQDYVECAGRTEPLDSAHSRLTALASVTGFPAVSVPGRLSSDGLPTGIQFIGVDEYVVCSLAATISRPAMCP